MVMFERYRKDRALELLKQTTRRLMSTLGEANAQCIFSFFGFRWASHKFQNTPGCVADECPQHCTFCR